MATWYNKYAAITLSAAAGLGAYQAVPWSSLSASDWGTWTGSIGTVLTLIGTIWLATAEARKRRVESITAARLHAVGMLWHLVYVQAVVSNAAADLSNANLGNAIATRAYTDETLNGVKLWTANDLMPLIPLRGNTAVKLARAADQIRLATSFLSKTRRMEASEVLVCAPAAADMLKSAAALLADVIAIFNTVESILGLRPR